MTEAEQEEYLPSMPANLPPPPEEDFFRYRIEGTDILEEIEHQLKGEVFDPQRNIYIEKFDRWINDEGINKVLHIIYSCGINKNIFLGNLLKEEIHFKCKMIKKKLALLLFKKYHNYGIKKEMRDLLITTVVNQIHSGLSRSEGGRESDQISTAAQRHEIYSHMEREKQNTPMSKLPFLRGGK